MQDIVNVVKARELLVRLQTSLLILEADGIKVIWALAIPINKWRLVKTGKEAYQEKNQVIQVWSFRNS